MMRVRILALVVVLAICHRGYGQGLLLPGVSPVNLSMGGAAAATPIDSMGALNVNVATISAMKNEVSVSLLDVMPSSEVTSSIAGLGSGTTESDSGGTVLPGFALVHRKAESPWTFGFAAVPVAGGRVNFPSSTTNPIFTPQSNTPGAPGGLGAVNANLSYFEFIMAASYALSDHWAVGFGPVVTASDLNFSPLILGPVDDADGSGQPRFSRDNGHAVHWGGGFQLGLYHIGRNGWNYGIGYKSEQWLEEALWNSTDELGRPTKVSWVGELPQVITIGASYSGCENVVFAIDAKYIDYSRARGCGDQGFGPQGNVLGPGQESIWVAAMGTQLRLTEQLYLRGGYTVNESPQDSRDANEAVFGPFFGQHTLHTGGSYLLNESLSFNIAYSLTLPSTLRGPINIPTGDIPGSSLAVDYHAHTLSVGATVKY